MKIKFIKIYFVLYFLITFIQAEDNIALPCEGCHGNNGNSAGESIPAIAGLNKEYIIIAMTEYKNDIRKNYLMRIIAKGYSKEQIDILGTYFSKQIYEYK